MSDPDAATTAEPLVSVIVPIYNVEAELRRCIDSLLAQDHHHLELVLVDDGSPDGCPAIVDEYATADARVVAIHKANAGVSAARNTGLDAATGEFVAFVDSDDWVQPDYLSRMLARRAESDADVCVCNFSFDFPSGAHAPFPLMTWRRQVSGEKAGADALDLLTIPAFVWNKLYRRSLFGDDLRFPSMYYEDVATVAPVMARARRVAVVHHPLYHYCLRGTSLTGSFTARHVRDLLQAVEIVRDFVWDSGRWEEWHRPYQRFLTHARLLFDGEFLVHHHGEGREGLAEMRATDQAFAALAAPPDRPRRPLRDVQVEAGRVKGSRLRNDRRVAARP